MPFVDLQIAAYRAMTPIQRLDTAMRLARMAKNLTRLAVRRRHPAATDEEVAAKVRRLGLYGRE